MSRSQRLALAAAVLAGQLAVGCDDEDGTAMVVPVYGAPLPPMDAEVGDGDGDLQDEDAGSLDR